MIRAALAGVVALACGVAVTTTIWINRWRWPQDCMPHEGSGPNFLVCIVDMRPYYAIAVLLGVGAAVLVLLAIRLIAIRRLAAKRIPT
jgi:hypothetical protein